MGLQYTVSGPGVCTYGPPEEWPARDSASAIVVAIIGSGIIYKVPVGRERGLRVAHTGSESAGCALSQPEWQPTVDFLCKLAKIAAGTELRAGREWSGYAAGQEVVPRADRVCRKLRPSSGEMEMAPNGSK